MLRKLFTVALAVTALCGVAHAATINVPADGTNLKSLIFGAAAGDEILINQPGVYDTGTTETLLIDKSLTIRGTVPGVVVSQDAVTTSDIGIVLIKPTGNNSVTVNLENLEVRMGNGDSDSSLIEIVQSRLAELTINLTNVDMTNLGDNKGFVVRPAGVGQQLNAPVTINYTGGDFFIRKDEGLEFEDPAGPGLNEPELADFTFIANGVNFNTPDDHTFQMDDDQDNANLHLVFNDCTFKISDDDKQMLSVEECVRGHFEFNRCVFDNSTNDAADKVMEVLGKSLTCAPTLIMRNCLIVTGDASETIEIENCNAEFVHNTFVAIGSTSGTGRVGILSNDPMGLSFVAKNNIFSANFGQPFDLGGTTYTVDIDSNLYADAGAAAPLGANALFGDPLFVDDTPSSPGNVLAFESTDYRLQTGSPARNQAVDMLYEVRRVDLEKLVRPGGSTPAADLGCYEIQDTLTVVSDAGAFFSALAAAAAYDTIVIDTPGIYNNPVAAPVNFTKSINVCATTQGVILRNTNYTPAPVTATDGEEVELGKFVFEAPSANLRVQLTGFAMQVLGGDYPVLDVRHNDLNTIEINFADMTAENLGDNKGCAWRKGPAGGTQKVTWNWDYGLFYTESDEGIEAEPNVVNGDVGPNWGPLDLTFRNVDLLTQDDHGFDMAVAVDNSNFVLRNCRMRVDQDDKTCIRIGEGADAADSGENNTLVIDRCTLDNLNADGPEMMILFHANTGGVASSALLQNSVFISANTNEDPPVLNDFDRALSFINSDVTIRNCTFDGGGNPESDRIAVLIEAAAGRTVEVTNCIFDDVFAAPYVADAAPASLTSGSNLYAHPAPAAVAGGVFELGTNAIIGQDPLFILEPIDETNVANLRIADNSPAVGNADPAVVALIGNIDRDNNRRPLGAEPNPDRGAYEAGLDTCLIEEPFNAVGAEVWMLLD